MRVLVLLCLCAAVGPVRGADRSCSDLRQFYTGKGFTLAGVPQNEISGEHLRMCPQGPTCCTSAMEDNLAGLSTRETEALIREAGRSLQASFHALHRSFDTYFTEQHGHSEKALQEKLAPLGPLYSQNTRLFGDLYTDLRQYYRGSALNLDETLSEFWSRLLERTFKSSASSDVILSEDYLECVAKQQETLRPFGDIPRDMKMKVVRAFVTARSFVQGLIVSGEVVRKVSQVSLSPECVKALMKLVYCPHCRDTMIQVASSFSTDPSLDVVLSSIPTRIYEAVLYLKDNMESFTAKVYQTCGTPGESGTGTPQSKSRGGRAVSVLTTKLREMRQYWIELPVALCGKVAEGASPDKCWNGMSKGRYLPEVMGDGLASQINNPEVELDITNQT
ncbi:hypothetical protein WMY93_025446 [Mugilogobius chulae]|uniref:Glypican-1 n=1 Tax=Mugilogobius chulae TaxID=88201 RepID=A0AAW0N2L6_9GOBI